MSLRPPTITHRGDKDVGADDAILLSDETFTIGSLDTLEEKHVSIMVDIEDIERRLDYLLTEVDG